MQKSQEYADTLSVASPANARDTFHLQDTKASEIPLSEVLTALSFALDLTEGQPMGHSIRSCVIGMRVAKSLGLSPEVQADLYYALLMKDAGCSTNASKMALLLGSDDIAAKRDVKTTDWTRLSFESVQYALSHVRPGRSFIERMQAIFDIALHQKQNAQQMVQIRCERGAQIARRIGLSEATASGIHSLDELWNGQGHPSGLRGGEIPLISRIMNLAQTVEVFYTHRGMEAAIQVAEKRKKRWFDPEIVRAFLSLSEGPSLWIDIEDAASRVLDFAPEGDRQRADDETLDRICLAFADVIDAKSPFTYRHSAGVAGAAVSIAETLALPEAEVRIIRRAALLHDIGKLSVPNTILDKPAKLSDKEWEIVKQHPHYTLEILRRIPGFSQLSELAASHHEKLDGSGYFRHKTAHDLSLSARIIVVADIYDALAAKRPYRDALPPETVFGIMQKEAPRCIDAECLAALRHCSSIAASLTAGLLQMSMNFSGHEVVHLALEPSSDAARQS